MQATEFYADDVEVINAEPLFPVALRYFDSTRQTHSQDASSIVELGKQLLQSAGEGDTEIVRELICRGAPFTIDTYGTSALHCAAQYNHVETAEVLLRAGISKDARTKVDRTPLHLAAYEGHYEMAQLLLTYGADVDSQDMLKMTPLHWAVEREHVDVMIVLLEHGADPNAMSKFDKTPITLALEHDQLDVVKLLQQEREFLNESMSAQEAQSTEIEEATNSIMTVEATRQHHQLQQYEIQPQLEQQKRKQSTSNQSKKQKVVFQQISMPVSTSDDEQDQETDLAERIIAIENHTFKKHKNTGFENLEQPLRLLQAHGITMLPVDNDASIVENAMESGRTVVLTEAGKLALNLTRQPSIGDKRLHNGSRKGPPRKLITIQTQPQTHKLLGQNCNLIYPTNPVLTSRGPNILKKNSSTVCLTSKPDKLVVRPVRTYASRKKVTATETVQLKNSELLHLDDEIEEIIDDPEESIEPVMDIATLNKQLIEARQLAAAYRKQLQMKQEEADIYKQQLQNIAAQKSAK